MAPAHSTSLNEGHARLLAILLCVMAGSADATSFLAFGLFSAHVTGNLVILTAHLVDRNTDIGGLALSVPLFIVMLCLTKLLAFGLEKLGIGLLRPLLFLQFLLLATSFAVGLHSGHPSSSAVRGTFIAGQFAVAAMAVQNALGQILLRWAPATTAMTTNLARFIMDAGDALFGHDPAEVAEASQRARDLLELIIGFFLGAGFGAGWFALGGRTALALPAGLALVAAAVGCGGTNKCQV
jgi:uncharacterized membrane protein YoaK (UPF0700 family)